jgi:hypothetical protein
MTAEAVPSRCRRQRDELRALCGAGMVGHAIDLAFEHFADFGRDDEIVELLADALERIAVPLSTAARFTELRGHA